MAVIKRNVFIVVYFTPDTTPAAMLAERNARVAQIKSLGYTDAEIKVRGPFDGALMVNDEPVDVKIAVAEVRP